MREVAERQSYRGVISLLMLVVWFATAAGGIPSGYYDEASGKSGSELKAALHDIVSDHTKYPYTSSNTDVWDILKASDEDPDNSNNVILLYTGRSQAKTENSGESSASGSNRWNREHVWSKSHGFPSESDTAYTDCHHIRPADESVNSSRNNRDFDEASTQHSEATECYYDNTAWTWEPRDAVKGDVARMMFYMAVRYDPGYHSDNSEYDLELVDSVGTTTGQPLFGKLSTLLTWHEDDPVDPFEQNRNEVVYSYQGNRNPFVDHPEYVDSLWNDALPAPTNLSATDIQETSLNLSWADNASDESGYYLYRDDVKISTLGANATSASVSGLSSGTTYTFKVSAYRVAEESSKTSLAVTTGGAGNLVITAVYDGPLSGGTPKGVELYCLNDIADLSDYGLGSANNGGGSDGEEFTFPAVAASAGDFITVASEAIYFNTWFGSNPSYTSGAMGINGDDAIELFYNGSAIDVYGDINVDGTGQSWDHLDGWAYAKNNRNPGTTFNSSEWTFSGTNALDGETSNATASSPVPLGTFTHTDGSLPVTLSYWTGESHDGWVKLTWSTESEIENLGFTIYKRYGSASPQIIGSYKSDPELVGQGSVSSRSFYSFIDDRVQAGETYHYQLEDTDYQGLRNTHEEIGVTVGGGADVTPGKAALLTAYPNPFNPEITLRFSLETAGTVSLTILDLQGRLIRQWQDLPLAPGLHEQVWEGKDSRGVEVPAGIYLVQLRGGYSQSIQRVTLLR